MLPFIKAFPVPSRQWKFQAEICLQPVQQCARQGFAVFRIPVQLRTRRLPKGERPNCLPPMHPPSSHMVSPGILQQSIHSPKGKKTRSEEKNEEIRLTNAKRRASISAKGFSSMIQVRRFQEHRRQRPSSRSIPS